MVSDTTLLKVINQLHDINKRASSAKIESIERSCERIRTILEEEGITIHNPLGERYNSSRTDCVANIIAKPGKEDLVITEVIKPVIYLGAGNNREVIQQGIVIVE